MIGNKSADKINKVSITSSQNSSETVTNEAENLDLIEKYLKKDIYISPEKRQKIIDDLRLI